MKNYKIIFVYIFLLFTSCNKYDIEGPYLNDLYGDLEIVEALDINNNNVSFSNNENVFFTAKFSKIVDWRIVISGLNSNAKKIITGKSNEINQSNSLWNGDITKLPFFEEENCNVTLSFDNHDDSISTSLNILSKKKYGNGNELIVSDFENGFNPNFTNFFQTTCLKKIELGNAGEGNQYLVQEGICDWDWLIGYVDYPAQNWFSQGTLNANPENIYFNIMIKGDSTLSPTNEANSLFKIEFYEDENSDGYYDASVEDRYDYEMDIDWNGWKMISIRYSNLILAGDPNGGGVGGNKIREPNKIFKVRTLLLANPVSGFAKADVDYLIWSEGTPILDQ